MRECCTENHGKSDFTDYSNGHGNVGVVFLGCKMFLAFFFLRSLQHQ